MSDATNLVRISALKTAADSRRQVGSLGIELPCDEAIATGAVSPLTQAARGEVYPTFFDQARQRRVVRH